MPNEAVDVLVRQCLTLGMEPTFGARLKSWLKFLGRSQAELSRALDVSKAAVHGWTTDASPTTDRIVPICAALGVSVAEFFARMPSEESTETLPDDELQPHPTTGEVTREIRFDVSDNNCPTCGHKTEAA